MEKKRFLNLFALTSFSFILRRKCLSTEQKSIEEKRLQIRRMSLLMQMMPYVVHSPKEKDRKKISVHYNIDKKVRRAYGII